jgi:hypothetical protein
MDENIPESQRRLLRNRRVPVRQIGRDIGRKGMKDHEVIALLHHLDRPTFFTLDGDYYDRKLCHAGYGLVHVDVDEDMAAEHVARLLRHPSLSSKAKRMGRIMRASRAGITFWQIHERQERFLSWP